MLPRPEAAKLDFSDDALTRVRSGMNKVTNEAGGSAYAWRITQPGFEMAGKTGSAQVRVYSEGQHGGAITKNENLEWKLRDHALFIAFAPVNDPKYAIVSIIEHGATVDHPHVQMARDVLLFCQQRDLLKLPTAYPVDSSASAAPAAKTETLGAIAPVAPAQLAKAGG